MDGGPERTSPRLHLVPIATDGRSARRDSNRAAVVDAMLTLLDAGRTDPSPADVAARAGVSERSVFRYFDGVDDLRQAVIARHFERVAPLLTIRGVGTGSIESRIRRFVEARLRFWAATSGPARVARTRALVPEVAAGAQRVRTLLDAQVREQFAPELAGLRRDRADELVLVVDVVFSFDAWDLMTAVHGRTTAQVRRAWTRTLHQLLTNN